MAHRSEHQYGTYRCPVCGHRDGAVLEREEGRGMIICSYCQTPLELSSRGRDSVRFTVQVAEEPASRC